MSHTGLTGQAALRPLTADNTVTRFSDRQTDKQTDKQMNRQTEGHCHRSHHLCGGRFINSKTKQLQIQMASYHHKRIDLAALTTVLIGIITQI